MPQGDNFSRSHLDIIGDVLYINNQQRKHVIREFWVRVKKAVSLPVLGPQNDVGPIVETGLHTGIIIFLIVNGNGVSFSTGAINLKNEIVQHILQKRFDLSRW